MTPWYEESFGSVYLDLYPHRNEEEAASDVSSILSLIGPAPDELLLDLGCGAGRHLISLSRAGCRALVGIDLSPALLAEAAKRLAASGATASLVRADMRRIPFIHAFAAVLSLFNSIGYFERDEENMQVFVAVMNALAPGGAFLIDYFNRDRLLSTLVTEDEQERSGMRIRNQRRITADGRRVEKHIEVEPHGGERREFRESVRLFTADELTGMLTKAGYRNIRCFGSFSGEPFRPESERLVVVARAET
jgi:SAM-dependent methyltransferase